MNIVSSASFISFFTAERKHRLLKKERIASSAIALFIFFFLGNNASAQSISSSGSLCTGRQVTITLAGCSYVPGKTFWTIPGTTNYSTGTTQAFITWSTAGTYTVSANYLCSSGNSGTIGISVTIVTSVTPTASLFVSQPSQCQGSTITFNASGTNGGTPTYNFFIDGVSRQNSTLSSYSTSALAAGAHSGYVIMASSITCVTGTATSSTQNFTINAPLSYTATVSGPQVICSGTPSGTFSVSTNPVYSPLTYQWYYNGIAVSPNGTGSTYLANSLTQGSTLYCKVTSTYSSCMITQPVQSTTYTVNITSSVTPSLSVQVSPTSYCAGATINLSTSGSNIGGSPNYQWLVNGTQFQSSTSSTASLGSSYTNTAGTYNVTVNATNISGINCLTSSSASANSPPLTVYAILTPAVSLSLDNYSQCQGSPIVFTAAGSNGGSPTYNFFIDGASVQNTSANTYSTSSLSAGAHTSYVILTSSLPCLTTSTAQSSTQNFTVNAPSSYTATVNGPPVICSGTSSGTFTVGTNPVYSPLTYQWYYNGIAVSPNGTGSTYLASSLTQGSTLYCKVSSTYSSCMIAQPVQSNTYTVNITSSSSSTAALSLSATNVCESGSITLTGSGTSGGSTPQYNFYVDGVSKQNGYSTTYPTSGLAPGAHAAYVVMTSSQPCVAASTSPTQNFTITGKSSYSVTLTGPPSICSTSPSGTFSAAVSPILGTLTYNWFLNGSSVGTNSSSYPSGSLSPGNTIYCRVSSDYYCLTATPVQSNTFTVSYTNPPAPTPTTNLFTFCEGSTMTMYLSGGVLPNPNWYSSTNQFVYSGSTYTPVNVDNGTYTFTVKNVDAYNCESASGVTITLQVGGPTANCDNYWNWQENIAYTYSGPADVTGSIAGDSKVYSDAFGNAIQSQTKSMASNQVIAAESIFDRLGKQTLTTLPAPINSSTFGYRYRFTTNSATSKAKYSWNDFDVPISTGAAGEVNNPNPVGNNGPGTLGWYYSPTNTSEPNTPTTNFPYARSYTPPGPNPLTSKSAGPGNTYHMGNSHEAQSDKIKITSAELSNYYSLCSLYYNSISGTPVGSPGYKLISTDPDGKKTASFIDADGKTVASALVTSVTGTPPNQTFTYDNWSYNFYSPVGLLIATVAPNGVNISSTSQPNFVTKYKYDQLGRLIETTSPDEGTSQFVYSTDGKIRFSQNQEQRNASNKRFSYTNYDSLGRLIEAGEYTKTTTGDFVFDPAYNAPSTNSVLNIVDNIGYTGATRRGHNTTASRYSDTTFIDYDTSPSDFVSDGTRTIQHNLIGQVSRTKNGNATTWYSYDEYGQLEWTMQNIIGLGIKTIDYMYQFLGNVTQVAYQNGNGPPSDRFFHHYTYDADSRLTDVSTSFDGSTKSTRAKYYYYLHGPLKRTELMNGAQKIQGIDYVYNIDGSLKAINHPDPLLDPGADGLSGVNSGFVPDAFGMALDYYASDYSGAGLTTVGTMAASGYTDQFGGLIKSQRWHSPVDNHVQRAYAYNYDNLDRFSSASWGSVTGSPGSYSFSAASPQSYKESIGTYDQNGNIQSLIRNGKGTNVLGNYTYHYPSTKNRLTSVTGGTNAVNYTYDSIGRMTKQVEGTATLNVTYNAYGLTKEVRDGSSNLMEQYFYDDRGDLVKKLTYNAGALLKTSYYVRDASGNPLAIYEANGGNALALAEEPIYGAGRIGMMKPKGGVARYFYEVNDHLGNVRAVVGDPTTDAPVATFETATMASDIGNFLRYDDARRINATLFDHTRNGSSSYSQRLNGSTNEKYGLARSLSVMPGDTVKLEVFAKYVDTNSNDWTSALTSLMSQIASNTAGVVIDGINYSSSTTAFPFAGLLSTSGSTGGPKAYLNWLIFDRNYTFITGGYMRLSSAPKEYGQNVGHERLATTFTVTEPSFVYAYLSNEETSPVEVYFDDFKVTQVHNRIVAGGDFYPFGLSMDTRQITQERYRFGYQGQFAEKDSLTNWNAFQLRMYEPRFGRWLSPDPYGQFASPYVAMGNNPVSGTDPNGGFCPECDELAALGYNVLPEVTITASFTGQIAGSLAGLTGALGRGVEYMQNPRGDLFYVHNTNEGSQVLKLGGDGWGMYRNEIKLAKIQQLNMYGFADKIGETVQDVALTLATGPAMDLAVVPVLKVAEGFLGRIFSRVAVQTTIHGAERIAGAAATRGGVLSVAEIGVTKTLGRAIAQGDGAIVYLQEISPGRFNAVIENPTTGKIITTMRNWSLKSIQRIAKNYGWKL
jgi:RHS repeat-associated protein